VCGAHSIKLTVTWHFFRSCDQGKITKKWIERQLWGFHWFPEPNFKAVLFQLPWFS